MGVGGAGAAVGASFQSLQSVASASLLEGKCWES